ncbi:MAG: prepilin-type N-terminal cleavage/methylation domain-containing protein [Patescibacteria group bacterium]
MVNKNLKTKRGFTLLEILIASALFAMVMLMTTGTIASSSSYQSKLKTMRETGEETRRIADMMTQDIREADGEMVVQGGTASVPVLKSFSTGIALLQFNESVTNSFSFFAFTNPVNLNAADSFSRADVLVLASKDKYKVYLFSEKYGKVDYKEFDRFDSSGNVKTLTFTNMQSMSFGAGECPLSTKVDLEAYFGGFAPEKNSFSASKQQPFIQFNIKAKTLGYATSNVSSRYQTAIQSMVTSRNYNK